MRFSLISLAAFGLAVTALVGMDRRADVDFGAVTGALSDDETNTGAANSEAARMNRLNDGSHPGVGGLKSPRAPLVVAQAAPVADTSEVTVVQARPASPPAAQPPAAEVAPQVDESALRYFAARGDTARLQAEISRLRALYPSWSPPDDPLAVRSTADAQLEAMWQLYAQARYADVRRAIADRQAAQVGWQPPADLLERLKLAEARMQLTTASDAKTYDEVIRISAENPTLLTCSEVDVLWRLAEAFAGTERQSRARDAYAYILGNCSDPSERLATVQKASELLPPDMLDNLLSAERTGAGGKPEFESLRDDLARRLVGEGNTDPKLVVPEKYLTRLERLAETGELASDALLLGWYHYRRENLGPAERWFRRAFTEEEEASAAEGLALTLTRQNSPLEAENVLYRWRDTSDGTRAAYMAAVANLLAIDPPPVLQEQVLARMAPVVIEARDAAAAQQFGWYARFMGQPGTAAQWFAAALSWKPDDEPSAYGLVLSRNDLRDRAGVAAIQGAWAGRSERIATLGQNDARATSRQYATQPPLQPSATAYQPVQQYQPAPVEPVRRPADRVMQEYAEAPVQRPAPQTVRPAPARRTEASRGCSTTVDPRQLSPQTALTRGWCLMDMNRPLEAVQAFDVATQASAAAARSDAAYGKSLAYLRLGLTDKAAATATTAPQNNTRAVELQSAILADRAVNAFKVGRFNEALIALDQRSQIVPEQNDLMSMRGYAYLGLGREADARRIFQALADVGNRDGMRALADLTAPSRY